MLELVNNTDWSAGLYPGWNQKRRPQMTLVIKTGFRFDEQGALTPMKTPPAIEECERYFKESGDSSLAAACDTVPFKEQTELFVFGTACPPRKDATVMEVSVGLFRGKDECWKKSLRIHGPRTWRKSLTGVGLSQPAALEPLPLRYEFSYGGRDPRNADQRYEKNPVGVGYSRRSRYHSDLHVPQIELSNASLKGLTERPEPAGFGPLAVFWEPRSQLQPGIDEEKLALGLCPYLGDVAPAFFNASPVDQRFPRPFEGKESILLKGFMVKQDGENAVLIHLPRISPKVRLQKGGKWQTIATECDTLVVSADERELHLVWRGAIAQSLSDPVPGWVTVDVNDQPKAEEG